jgi:hypothetical protein
VHHGKTPGWPEGECCCTAAPVSVLLLYLKVWSLLFLLGSGVSCWQYIDGEWHVSWAVLCLKAAVAKFESFSSSVPKGCQLAT